jgi:hypothetical protein
MAILIGLCIIADRFKTASIAGSGLSLPTSRERRSYPYLAKDVT